MPNSYTARITDGDGNVLIYDLLLVLFLMVFY